ncbi:hypothetical protein T484DRAFT_1934615 [Baffinella frigidus]|nr:hypothetical protein T484DRAFT_1934615 [Cryptophyta sp. CCMP2293]
MENRKLRSQLLAGSVGVVLAVLIVGGAVDVVSRRAAAGPVALYDIPNFIAERTQTHFPQAEENWLNLAAQGKIGDDVKPQNVLNNLNTIISDSRTHALQENYEARVKAKVDAMTENYDTYDVHKGKVVHKMYGKQVAGSVSLEDAGPVADKTNGVQAVPVPDLKAQPVALSSAGAAREASQMLAAPASGGMMYRQQQLAAAHPQQLSFGVKVPAGLSAGQKFVANVPGHGQMLVYVPKGVTAGEVVAIHVGAATAAPRRPQHHQIRQHMAEHTQRQQAGGKRGRHAVLPYRRGVAGYTQDMQSEAHAERRISVRHPLADKMFDEALDDHYKMRSHTYGLEK